MPLTTGQSRSAFKHNVEAEMAAGKGQKQSVAIAYAEQRKSAKDESQRLTARNEDMNGFITIDDNPISRSGVFQYLGSSIGAEDPNKIYNVYRPAEELSHADAIESFKLIPFVDDHTMLGSEDIGLVPAEFKGVHGSTGEEVEFRDGVLYAKLRIFSETLKRLLAEGKKEISLGYRCVYEKASGIFNGEVYDYIQRNLRGNHLALVDQARCNVAVLDSNMAFDHFDLALNFKEFTMADEKEEGEKGEAKGEMSMTEAHAMLKDIMPKIAKINELMKKHGGGAEEDEMESETETAVDEITAKPSVKPGAAGAGVTDEEEEEKKKGEAKDKEEEYKKKSEGMDAAVNKLTAEVQSLKKSGIKSMLTEVARRDSLANKLSSHIGTFDHTDKTLNEVAEYGIKKLGINCPKGQELTALDGFLHNRESAQTSVSFGLDATTQRGGKLAEFLKSKAS